MNIRDQSCFNILSNVKVILISTKQIFSPSDVSYLTGQSPVGLEIELLMLCQLVITDSPLPPSHHHHHHQIVSMEPHSWPWPPSLLHNKLILYCEYCVGIRTQQKFMLLLKDSDKNSLAYTWGTGIADSTSREFKVPFQKPLYYSSHMHLLGTFILSHSHCIQAINLNSSHIGNKTYDLAVDSTVYYYLGWLCI